MTYEGYGQPFANLSVCRVAVWNAGRETIRRIDIPKGDPFVIASQSEDHVFLDVRIEATVNSNNAVEATISRDKKQIRVIFEYLDYAEGAVIQIVHTGTNSASIRLQGTVMGGGVPRNLDELTGFARLLRTSDLSIIILVRAFITIALGVLVGAFASRFSLYKDVLVSVLVMLLVLALMLVTSPGFSKLRQVPKGLRRVFDPVISD
jgi:hypothetical protein